MRFVHNDYDAESLQGFLSAIVLSRGRLPRLDFEIKDVFRLRCANPSWLAVV